MFLTPNDKLSHWLGPKCGWVWHRADLEPSVPCLVPGHRNTSRGSILGSITLPVSADHLGTTCHQHQSITVQYSTVQYSVLWTDKIDNHIHRVSSIILQCRESCDLIKTKSPLIPPKCPHQPAPFTVDTTTPSKSFADKSALNSISSSAVRINCPSVPPHISTNSWGLVPCYRVIYSPTCSHHLNILNIDTTHLHTRKIIRYILDESTIY